MNGRNGRTVSNASQMNPKVKLECATVSGKARARMTAVDNKNVLANLRNIWNVTTLMNVKKGCICVGRSPVQIRSLGIHVIVGKGIK